jgi:hypothetical protein
MNSRDYLPGFGEQRRWHRQPERLGCLQINHEIEFGRLHDRQVGRLFALEDPADIGSPGWLKIWNSANG